MPVTKAAQKRMEAECLYGCDDPRGCPYPHKRCLHCKEHRKQSGWTQPASSEILSMPYTEHHT